MLKVYPPAELELVAHLLEHGVGLDDASFDHDATAAWKRGTREGYF